MAEAIEAGGGTVFQVADWKDDDEVTTTFGSIRQGMAEAAEAERERILALLDQAFMSANYSWDAGDFPSNLKTKWQRYRGDVRGLINEGQN
jgi:hypothetical protein